MPRRNTHWAKAALDTRQQQRALEQRQHGGRRIGSQNAAQAGSAKVTGQARVPSAKRGPRCVLDKLRTGQRLQRDRCHWAAGLIPGVDEQLPAELKPTRNGPTDIRLLSEAAVDQPDHSSAAGPDRGNAELSLPTREMVMNGAPRGTGLLNQTPP